LATQDLPTLHRRYVDLAGRFKAAWTFHQFLQGLQKFFASAQIPKVPTDLTEIHAALKRVSENLTGTAPPRVALELESAGNQLDQTMLILSAADSRVTPPLMRQFFERVKNYDEQILAQMIRFYLSLAADEGLTGDRLDKVDFLLTKLSEEEDPVSSTVRLRDRARLRMIFEGFWNQLDQVDADAGWVEEKKGEIASFRRELSAARDLASFSAEQIVPRYREVKRLLGRYLFHPELMLAVAETNLAVKNRVRESFHEEEKRILDESQRMLQLDETNPDLGAAADLSALRRTVREVERKQRADNVKLDDLDFLRRQVEELRPRLLDSPVEPRREMAPGAGEEGIDESLLPHFRELMAALEGTDNRASAKEAALSRDLYEFRLEPREVMAFRHLHVDKEGDAKVDRMLLEAAALRRQISVDATEISELLDETAVTRDSPVFERARRTTRLAESYVQKFASLLDESVRSNNFGEAQQLQLLRMRLIRDYSGLWLLVHRPTT